MLPPENTSKIGSKEPENRQKLFTGIGSVLVLKHPIEYFKIYEVFMMKWLSVLLLLLNMTGCLANNGLGSAAASQDNIWNLSRLSIGMNESQVMHVMHQPYMKRSFENEGNIYHIWFYVTRPVGLDQSRLVRQNLTPLTFENGVLLGWGFDFYHHVIRKIEKGPSPATEQKPDKTRERSLEKTIEEIETAPNAKSKIVPVTMQKATENKASGAKNKKGDKPKSKEDEEEDNSKVHLDEEDEEMIKGADEQNFDFW